MQRHAHRPAEVIIRPALKADLPGADRVIRVAFGTAAGVPDPGQFFGDMNMVQNRWETEGTAVLVAESGEEIVSSAVATRWGSFGFFGPFGVMPDLWDQGIAKAMVAEVMNRLNEWQVRLAGLYTTPDSPRHIGLYQQFGFMPRYLTAVMTKHLPPLPGPQTALAGNTYSDMSPAEKTECLGACLRLTDSIFEGLDLTTEIEAIEANRLGDTLLLQKGSKITGFAACHLGIGTEAGSDACYVKFAAAPSDASGQNSFKNLLNACEAYARKKGVSKLLAGVNTSRREAYEKMLQHGFRTTLLGVAMLRPDTAGFNRPGVFVIDDWR